MDTAIHSYYLHNGLPVDRRYFEASSAGSRITVYEVLRMTDGVPLFLEDHYLRLQRSARLVGRVLNLPITELEQNIRQLIKANNVLSGNIKIQVQWDDEGRGDLYACFIRHRYPSAEDYRLGVRVDLLAAERDNPNAKVANPRVRELADNMIRDQQLYEVLLVDHDGFVTEGSRSNFFIIRGEEIATPPISTVLPGITRGKVLELCQRLGRPVRQEPIHRRDLRRVAAAFLSGTSPGVLPIAAIGSQRLDPRHPLLLQIHDHYETLMRDYLVSHGASAGFPGND